jgi:hypothetical protein
MHPLFDYAANCAAHGELWETPEHSIRRNLARVTRGEASAQRCPGG